MDKKSKTEHSSILWPKRRFCLFTSSHAPASCLLATVCKKRKVDDARTGFGNNRVRQTYEVSGLTHVLTNKSTVLIDDAFQFFLCISRFGLGKLAIEFEGGTREIHTLYLHGIMMSAPDVFFKKIKCACP